MKLIPDHLADHPYVLQRQRMLPDQPFAATDPPTDEEAGMRWLAELEQAGYRPVALIHAVNDADPNDAGILTVELHRA